MQHVFFLLWKRHDVCQGKEAAYQPLALDGLLPLCQRHAPGPNGAPVGSPFVRVDAWAWGNDQWHTTRSSPFQCGLRPACCWFIATLTGNNKYQLSGVSRSLMTCVWCKGSVVEPTWFETLRGWIRRARTHLCWWKGRTKCGHILIHMSSMSKLKHICRNALAWCTCLQHDCWWMDMPHLARLPRVWDCRRIKLTRDTRENRQRTTDSHFTHSKRPKHHNKTEHDTTTIITWWMPKNNISNIQPSHASLTITAKDSWQTYQESLIKSSTQTIIINDQHQLMMNHQSSTIIINSNAYHQSPSIIINASHH